MKAASESGEIDAQQVVLKAIHSAVVQRRRGAREDFRTLYYEAYSILRTFHHYFGPESGPEARKRAA